MVNLNEFIYESLLSNDLEKEQTKNIKKLIEHPWEYFYKNVSDGMDYNDAVERLIQSLRADGAKDVSKVSQIFPNKDQIVLTVRKERSVDAHSITFTLGDIYKNKLTIADGSLRFSNRTSNRVKMFKMRNMPTIDTSSTCFWFGGAEILHQYILNKKQSEQLWDVLSMIYDKCWDNHWKKLAK